MILPPLRSYKETISECSDKPLKEIDFEAVKRNKKQEAVFEAVTRNNLYQQVTQYSSNNKKRQRMTTKVTTLGT